MNTVPKEDLLALSTTIRWIGIGILPSPANVRAAINNLQGFPASCELGKVWTVLQTYQKGVLPSQVDCQDAQEQLLRVPVRHVPVLHLVKG